MFGSEFCGRDHQVADDGLREIVKGLDAVVAGLSVEVVEVRSEGLCGV